MAPRCTICAREDRVEIDRVLAFPHINMASYARSLGASLHSLKAHRRNHLNKRDVERIQQEPISIDTIWRNTDRLDKLTLQVIARAKKRGDDKVVLSGVREAIRIQELMLRLLEQIDLRSKIDIIQSKQWIELRTVVFEIVAEDPELKRELLERLTRIQEETAIEGEAILIE